jgi:nucleoside-diphosphate-sugar epimerase
MRIAITGASGFVGRHVLRTLQSRNLDIVVVNRSAGQHTTAAHTEIVLIDIAHDLPDPFLAMGKPDVLIHLAWDGLPNYQSHKHVEIELPLQQRFLTKCVASGLKRLVVTGTCFEYGLVTGELTEDSPTQPCTQYGLAKNMLRQHLEGLKSEHSFQMAWLRLFYLYGEDQSKSSLYSLLTDAIRRAETEFDMSGGEQIRDFLPIQAAACIIADIALIPADIGVINVCSGVPTTVRDLVATWIAEKNSSIVMNLGRIPYSAIEPMAFWGSRKKLDFVLGAV